MQYVCLIFHCCHIAAAKVCIEPGFALLHPRCCRLRNVSDKIYCITSRCSSPAASIISPGRCRDVTDGNFQGCFISSKRR